MSEKKSWRDVYKVHPAADVFPMLPEDELRKLGEDIQNNGLKEHVVFWSDTKDDDREYLLDGRNRLAAMELVGLSTPPFWKDLLYGYEADPYIYVISKNIRRRHLTKEQQAELIVKVMKAGTDFAKLARSVKRDSNGKVQGSTKDPVKEKVVEEAKKHGISKRTMERAIANDRGPTKPKRRSYRRSNLLSKRIEDRSYSENR